MLRSVRELEGYTIHARDGDIGSLDQCLFDDQTWTIRYFVVDTGGWLTGRLVLISPYAIEAARHDDQTLDVNLTKRQVENSPDIDTDKPVSRQKEIEYAQYYGYPYYWGGMGLWGTGAYPTLGGYPMPPAPVAGPAAASQAQAEGSNQEGNQHLRSTREVIGYGIHASDGALGHVDDFLADDQTWALHYMVVDTRDWWPGKRVLVAPRWISSVRWGEASVHVDLPRETIKGAPEFDAYQPVSRDYEQRLHDYYRRDPYWHAEQPTGDSTD